MKITEELKDCVKKLESENTTRWNKMHRCSGDFARGIIELKFDESQRIINRLNKIISKYDKEYAAMLESL